MPEVLVYVVLHMSLTIKAHILEQYIFFYHRILSWQKKHEQGNEQNLICSSFYS